ncbi:MAG: NUDIX hydrolase [Myxococcota bacterium]
MNPRVLYEGAFLRLEVERVELPNGNRIELEIVHHPGAAAVVPFLDAERILMLRQYRHAAGGYLWEIPAGKLEPGEDPLECARRELEEETGYRTGRIERVGSLLTTPGFSDERIHLFFAWELEAGASAHEAAEVISVHEVDVDEALARIDRGEIVDGKTLAALYHVARRRASGFRSLSSGG